ncbi:MAG: YbaN family protein [Planctomycetota bacterium]
MKRYFYAGLGIAFVGIAAVGVWLPLIPTVGPLLIASFFFAKSFPALEKRLIRNRFFAAFIGYLDGTRSMTHKERLAAIGMMWTSILISGLVLWLSKSPTWMLWVLIGLGIIGTFFISRFRLPPKGDTQSTSDVSQT